MGNARSDWRLIEVAAGLGFLTWLMSYNADITAFQRVGRAFGVMVVVVPFGLFVRFTVSLFSDLFFFFSWFGSCFSSREEGGEGSDGEEL